MAVRTTTQSGNISSSSTFGGSAFASGDRIVFGSSSHSLTIDTDSTVGDSRPARSTSIPNCSAVAGGGSLATGTYRVAYTNVDAAGAESAISPEGGNFGGATISITSGQTLRVVLPALPSGVSSRNIYLTSGSAGTTKIYKTGTTGTTIDLTSGSWTDGTTTEAAAASFPQAFAIEGDGPITVNTGVTLKVRGDVSHGGSLTLTGTAILELDASAANSPGNTPYRYFQGTSNSGQTGIKIQTSGTSAGVRVTVRSNAGGANGRFAAGVGAGFVGSFVDTTNWAVSFIDFLRVGSSTLDAIVTTPNATSTVQSFDHFTFDQCGRVNLPATLAGGYSLTYGWFTNSLNTTSCLLLGSANGVNVGSKSVSNVVFLTAPSLGLNGWNYSVCYFHQGWILASTGSQGWAAMDVCFVRNSTAASTALSVNGDITGSYIIYDTGYPISVSGTATSATSTTLSDTSKSWTTNQFQSAASSAEWDLIITGGTGAGQIRQITANTSTQLTIAPAWTADGGVTPDATSTYAISHTVHNPHYTSPTGLGGNGGTLTSVSSGSSLVDNTQTTVRSTTVSSGANSATQTVGSTTGWQAGDILQFSGGNVAATTTRRIISVTDGTHVVLDQAINTTTTTTQVKKGPGGASWTTLLSTSYTGYTLTMESGAAAGQSATVTAINTSTGGITLATAISPTPSAGDQYRISIVQKCNDNVYEGMTCSAEGDCWYSFGGSLVYYEMKRTIILPCASGLDNSGTPVSVFSNQASTSYLTLEHLTICAGSQSISINEGGNSTQDLPPGVILSCRSNLAWSPLSSGSYPTGPNGGSGGPYIVTDNNPSHITTDQVVASACDYNAAWHEKAGYANTTDGYSATGYNLHQSSAPGTHDQTSAIASAGPQFIDRTRTLGRWAVARGYSSSANPITRNSDAIAALQADTSRIADLISWVRAGFNPVNTALQATAHDGGDIGAMPVVGPPAVATLSATLGAITCAAGATAAAPPPSAASLSVTLGAITISATAAAALPPSASAALSATLASISLTASATSATPGTTVGSLSATLGTITLSATATASPAAGGARTPLEAALLAYLSTDASIASLSPARIVCGRIPQRVKDGTPAIGFRVISRKIVNNLDGDTGYTKARVQIGSIGKDGPEAERTAFAVRKAIAAMPWSISGIEIAAALIDEIDDEDDAIPAGTDSTRTDYVSDAQIHYREDLGLDP